MKQGNNSHNSCWVREGPSPWQPLLSEAISTWEWPRPTQAEGRPEGSTHRVPNFWWPGPLWDTSWVTDIYTGPHYFQCPHLKGVDQYPVLVTAQNNLCRLGVVHHLPAWWWLVRIYLLHDFGQNSPAWWWLVRTHLLGGVCSAPTWWWLVSTCLGGSIGQELSMSRPVD